MRWRTPEYYSDFTDNFDRNPTTGALATVTNEDSINQSIRNLVLTRPGSRPGRNAIGSKVMSSLFDLATPATLDVLQSTIENVIANYEPRAENVVVTIDRSAATLMSSSISVTITYQPVNLPQTVSLSLDLKRTR